MIDGLHNRDLFYKENDLFKKYFLQRIRNENELLKELALSKMFLNFYQKVFNPNQKQVAYGMFDFDFFGYGYIDDYGYYTIHDGNNGYYVVTCYDDNINKAFINVAQSCIDRNAKFEEIQNRKEIKKMYKNRFGCLKNYRELYYINYALIKWNDFYDGKIPNEIVEAYLCQLDIDKSKPLDTKKLIICDKIKARKK